MKIEYLKLHNWCSIADAEHYFQNGLIGIFGHNGAGKSTSMQAIGFGLTGVTTGRREDSLKYGTKEGYVVVGFRLDGTGESYRVHRNIHNPDVVLYKLEGADWVRMTQKAPQARELLESLTTITKDMITQILMVSQETVTTILSDTESRRNEIFQRIFSLQMLPRLRDKLIKVVRNAEVKLGNLKYQKEFLKDKIRSQQEAIKAYGNVEGKYTLTKMSSELTQAIGSIHTQLGQLQGMEFLHAEKKRLESQMYVLKQKLTTQPPENPHPDIDRELYAAKRVELMDRYNALRQISKPISDLLKFPKVKGPTRDELKNLFERLSAKSQELISVEAEYKKYKACAETGTCPTCGSHVEVTKDLLDEIADRLKKLKAERDSLGTEYQELESRANAISEQNARAEANITSCKAMAEALGFQIPEENWLLTLKDTVKSDYSRCVSESASTQKVLEAMDKYSREYDSWETMIKTVKDQIEQANTSLEEIYLNPLFGKSFTKTELELQEELSALKKKYQSVQERLHYRMQYEALLAQRDETYKDLERLDMQISDLHPELVDSLQFMADFLAPSEFPRRVSASLYHLLTTRINSCLEEFEFPFTVDITDSGEFTCKKSDGMVQSSSRLSGGEKMVVSIAFRLALHDLFAQRDSAGFILLDEPTTFLDDANRKYLSDVLGHLKASPRFGGMQIFVVTHDDSLKPLFDNIVDLGRER